MTEQSEDLTVTSRSPSDAKACESIGDQAKVPDLAALPVPSVGGMQMFPTMYPALIPNFGNTEIQEHSNRGAGLYAVPVVTFGGSVTGQIPNTLIPLTYSVPTASASESGATSQENEPAGHQHALPEQQGGPEGPDRVRQFQIAINVDLPLLVKLMAVIYLFHQDGSKRRLALLVFFASIIYLYQTGALAPLTRWLSRFLNRVPQPARPPRDALPPDDVNLGNENAVLAERRIEGEGGNEVQNDNQEAVDGGNVEGGNNNQQGEEEAEGRHNVNPLWAVMKEIQIFVLGFITSLLPGFQHQHLD